MSNKETQFYREGLRVDEIKPHYTPGTNILCKGKSGIVNKTEMEGRKAEITCDTCGAIVKEEV